MSTLIFGKGYCGRYLKPLLANAQCAELPDLKDDEDIPFDFNDTNTWEQLTGFDTYVFTLKMENTKNAARLAQLTQGSQRIILSSARCFGNSLPDQLIDETTPIKNTLRNQCESLFLPNACLMHLGLIWGKDREPQTWLKEGRIRNGQKFINMIHLHDIGNIVKNMIHQDQQGRFLISDGIRQRWSEFAATIDLTLPANNTGQESRVFNTEKLQACLPEAYKFLPRHS